MNNRVKVTIIIPIFNTEKYLMECIESGLHQTLDAIEIILINDGSTDNSGEIAKSYANRYSYIKYIEQVNQGQGAARNRALSIAKGKYIYFLDSDDYIHISAMEELYKEAEKEDLDLILFEGESFYDEEYVGREEINFSYKRTQRYDSVTHGEDLFVKLINNKDFTSSPCLYLIRKSVIEKYKLRFCEGIIHEDELFIFELILRCKRAKHIDKGYFFRRIRTGSTMTGRNYLKSFIGYSTVLFKMTDGYKRSKFSNKDVEQAVYTRIRNMFINSIVKFSYLQSKERKENKKTINKLKKIGKEFNYFKSIAVFLFTNFLIIFRLAFRIKKMIMK